MNPEFKVLTTQSNLKTPLIQNRFRNLTLQSPSKLKSPNKITSSKPPVAKPTNVLQENVNPPNSQNNKSEMDTITNKLMLSSSSSNISEQHTNFIQIETEPFTNPLQVETEPFTNPLQLSTTENEETKKKSSNDLETIDLTAEMEKLDVSQVSIDLFSQFTRESSEIILPPNRVLTQVDNIDNLSQRISSIRMSDEADDNLAATQPNTQPRKATEDSSLADTQPNTAPIVLSDSEDDDEGQDNINASLLTEETDDSIIEVLSSDGSFHSSENRVPKDTSTINAQQGGISETVVHKLNHFFENIPTTSASQNNCDKILMDKAKKNDIVVSADNSIKSHSDHTEINVPETSSEIVDEILKLDASHANESLDKSMERSNVEHTSDVQVSQQEDNKQNDNVDNSPNETSESLQRDIEHGSNNQSDKSSAMETTSEDQTSQKDESNANDLANYSQLSEDHEEIENSFHPTSTKKVFKLHATSNSNSNTLSFNTPRINISAKVNINIKLSVVSSSTATSDTDTSQEIDDSHQSEASSKNNTSMSTETAADLSSNSEYVAQCKQAQSNKNYIVSTDHVDEKEASITESSLIHPEQENIPSSTGVVEQVDEEVNGSTGVVEQVDEDVEGSPDVRTDVSSVADISTTKKVENISGVSRMDTLEEIDEVGEELLNDIYGDTWRTPQLVKKCFSTKKKYLTDVGHRNRSRGFSLFRQDISSELDSTRITPDVSEKVDVEQNERQHTTLDTFSESTGAGQVNGSIGNQSSRILRTCRKVPANRILDYSSEENESDVDESDVDESDVDESDVDESGTDDSFKPTADLSEESDSSYEEIVLPKRTPRKNNKFIYLDLTCQEVIEDEDHISPNATTGDLEVVSKKFLESLQSEEVVQTPVPTKTNVPTTTTKRRKLFTHNYDDQPPFEEIKTPVRSPIKTNDKVVQLKTPIPTYLIPPKYRDKQLTTIDGKKVAPQSTPVTKRTCGFLESLDDKEIPEQHCDLDALKFRNKFKQNRNELVKRLMRIYNEHVFGNKLKDIPVTWSKTLRTTAGHCYLRKRGGVRVSNVELSDKVATTAERVRDTLIHELCHAAAWIFDGENGHGTVFKMWGDKCTRNLPELPKITICHDYVIDYKFTYKCTVCGLRSKAHSKPKKEAVCATCHGPIEVFLNQKDKDGQINLIKPKEVTGFPKFVQENYKLFKEVGRAHADVMKILSNNFGKLTVQEKLKYKK